MEESNVARKVTVWWYKEEEGELEERAEQGTDPLK